MAGKSPPTATSSAQPKIGTHGIIAGTHRSAAAKQLPMLGFFYQNNFKFRRSLHSLSGALVLKAVKQADLGKDWDWQSLARSVEDGDRWGMGLRC